MRLITIAEVQIHKKFVPEATLQIRFFPSESILFQNT